MSASNRASPASAGARGGDGPREVRDAASPASERPRSADRSIVLVGLMGTGKSTTGSGLGERLGRAYLDTDDLILARTGRTVREIFAGDGEAAFRALETGVLLDALASSEPIVLAAAGGVVLAEANRRALRESAALVVWLRANPTVLVRRVAGQEHRPLLDDDPAGTLARMGADREPLYREVADLEIDVDALTPAEVVERVLAEVEART